MIIRHFLKWAEGARVEQRAAAATALANAYLANELPFEERCEAEAALTLLLDDPAPRVRLALAEAMSLSHRAPPQIVAALAQDQPEIAALMILRSPLLSEADLVDRVGGGDPAIQKLVASRPYVPMGAAAALAELGDERACLTLLDNGGADLAAFSLRRIAERLGGHGPVRTALLHRRDLPAAVRHMLVQQLGRALTQAPLVRGSMGPARAERLSRESCTAASLTLIETTPSAEHPALVEHLRLAGEITPAFLVRIAAHGRMDFLAATVARLAGRDRVRVNGVLASGGGSAVCSLLRAAGIAADLHAPLLAALRIWREVANGRLVAGPQEASFTMLKACEPERPLATVLKAIHLETLRENARRHALELAA